MKRLLEIILVIVLGLVLTTSSFAGPGTAVLPYLTSPVGARAIALSGATGGLVDGAYSLFSNPALLAYLLNGEGNFSHQIGVAKVSSEMISVAYPVPQTATFALGLIYRGQPDIDNVAGEAAIKVYDLFVNVAGARRIDKKLSWGGGIKYINSTLGEYSATAFALDLGMYYTVADQINLVNLGLAIQNVGTNIKYISYSAPLPTTFRASIGVQRELTAQHVLASGINLNYGINDSLFVTQVGVEYTYAKMASIRLGYSLGAESINSLSMGVGVRYAISGLEYHLDYAFAPKLWNGFDQSEAEHTVSLGIAF